jgi:hypothetical protein
MRGFLRTTRSSSFFWRSEGTEGLPLRGILTTLAVVQYFLHIFWTARCERVCSSATDLVLHSPSNFSMITLRSFVEISDLVGRYSLSAAGAGCCGDMVVVVGEKAVAFVLYEVTCTRWTSMEVDWRRNDYAVPLGKRSCLLPRLMMLEAEGEG